MAHHASAKKRIRRNARRAQVNHSRMGRIRTIVKTVEAAIDAGDKTAATDAFKQAMPELMRGRSKGVLHANTVSRKISRLNARIKAL